MRKKVSYQQLVVLLGPTRGTYKRQKFKLMTLPPFTTLNSSIQILLTKSFATVHFQRGAKADLCKCEVWTVFITQDQEKKASQQEAVVCLGQNEHPLMLHFSYCKKPESLHPRFHEVFSVLPFRSQRSAAALRQPEKPFTYIMSCKLQSHVSKVQITVKTCTLTHICTHIIFVSQAPADRDPALTLWHS